ncbi:MAG: NifB/NifX family molybdenum-iron cluster-binding protein, partial [Methanosarcinales archaeon]
EEKVAYALEEDKETISKVFARAPYFRIGNRIVKNPHKDEAPAGIKAAEFIASFEVDKVVAGSFGPNALRRLNELGIKAETLMKKELKYEDKATFIRVHLHDIRDFTRCEGEEKVKRYEIPKLPEGVEANICLYPRPGTIHGARIQSLKFDKKLWSIERIKREFDFKPYIEWQGVQVRG